VFLLFPMIFYVAHPPLIENYKDYLDFIFNFLDVFNYQSEDIWLMSKFWSWIAILLCGQALLLFLSVDTSWRRNKPRQHVLVTGMLAGLLTGLLVFFYIWTPMAAIFGDKIFDWPSSPFAEGMTIIFRWWLGFWIFWGILFYWYYRNSDNIVSKAVSLLLAGSVLELLIAVPAHIIVRHRDQCSAPGVTGWGIVTGIAVMLLCFGPGVFALYKKRIDSYSAKRGETQRT
ncbi:MAG: hypothetical protein ACRESK_06600, partial [Gammaproteobacteria bacterium]